MENLARVFQKQRKKQEIEFQNRIQEWIFTTFYRLKKVFGKLPETPMETLPLEVTYFFS